MIINKNYNHWTTEELEILDTKYNQIPFDELIALLPRHPPGSIKVIAHNRKLTKPNPKLGIRYDLDPIIDDVKELRKQGGKWCSISELYQIPKRSFTRKLKGQPTCFDRYTPEDDQIIKDNYNSMSDEELAVKMGRTPLGIMCRRKRLKLRKEKWDRTHKPDKEKEDFIRNNYKNMTDRELAEILNSSEKAIQSYRFRRGWKKRGY